jgi:hypothetical protein
MTTRRQIFTSIPATGAAFALGGALFDEGPAHAQQARPTLDGHFHPKGKAPSAYTIRAIEAAKSTLPFDDTRDLDEQKRGLIAERPARQIMADAGNVAFNRYRLRLSRRAGRTRLDPPLDDPHREAEQQLRPLRGGPGHLSGAGLRPGQRQLRARPHRVDRLRRGRPST